MRIRKKDVLKDKGQDMVLRPASPGSTDDIEKLLVLVSPDRPREIIDKSGVKAKVREAWQKTQIIIDRAGDDWRQLREFRFDVIADRRGAIYPMTVRMGGQPTERPIPGGVERRFPGGGLPKKPDPGFDTLIGTVHTHPVHTPPSPDDHHNFKDTTNWGESYCRQS